LTDYSSIAEDGFGAIQDTHRHGDNGQDRGVFKPHESNDAMHQHLAMSLDGTMKHLDQEANTPPESLPDSLDPRSSTIQADTNMRDEPREGSPPYLDAHSQIQEASIIGTAWDGGKAVPEVVIYTGL